tara:strand:- start:300 stop:419 length:120 start_codon:yes stop_codon:yes gene_type:complete
MRAMVRMKDGGRREKRRGKDEDHGTKVGKKGREKCQDCE